MQVEEAVANEFKKISLFRAVETVFQIKLETENIITSIDEMVSIMKFEGMNAEKYIITNLYQDSDQEYMQFNSRFQDVLSYGLSYTQDNKLRLTHTRLNDKIIAKRLNKKIDFKYISRSMRKKENKLFFEYPVDEFFELNKLARFYDEMDLVKVKILKSSDTEKCHIITYEIDMVPSQEVLNVFIERYCDIFIPYKDKRFKKNLQRRYFISQLRRLGVKIPNSADLDILNAAKQFFPFKGEVYTRVNEEYFNIEFGGNYYNKETKSLRPNYYFQLIYRADYPSEIQFYINLKNIENKQKKNEYTNSLIYKLIEIGYVTQNKSVKNELFERWKNRIDSELNFHVPIISQHQLEQLFSVFRHFYQKIEHADGNNNLLETFLQQNIVEQDAFALFDVINDDFSSVKASADVNQKNKVYYVIDKKMQRKIVKIMAAEEEANIEHMILAEFGKHPVLSQYVPKLYSSELIEITIDGIKRYAIIEEDVCNKEQELFERLIAVGNKKQVVYYLDYWMKTLAQLHHYGTEIIENYLESAAQKTIPKNALRLLKEKDRARIISSGIVYDHILQTELASLDLESRNTFIHQDLRYENRIGKIAIDWGYAGRGNAMLDIIRIFIDPKFECMRFTEDNYKQHINQYLTERKRVEINTQVKKYAERTERRKRVSQQELETAYFDFSALRVMYAESQAAYLITINGEGRRSSLMADFLQYKLPSFEKVFTR